jgi:hypothetical protein
MKKTTTTKKRNPRYVATDESGYELAFIPAFNAAEALKIAKKRYPGRKLKITKVDEQMYIGRGAKELEAKERQLRRIARAGSRKRNPLGDADAAQIYHELNEAGQGFAIGEDYDDIGTASAASGWHVVHRYTISLLLAEDPAGRQFLVGGDGQGRGPWAVSVPRENPRRRVARTVTRRAVARGVVQPRRRNATHIHADKIDHLDVAKIHNPEFETIEDVWDAISGEPVISSSRSAPEGNYSMGLILEEYALNDGSFLQVALDPATGGQPVEWHHSAFSEDSWVVG